MGPVIHINFYTLFYSRGLILNIVTKIGSGFGGISADISAKSWFLMDRYKALALKFFFFDVRLQSLICILYNTPKNIWKPLHFWIPEHLKVSQSSSLSQHKQTQGILECKD